MHSTIVSFMDGRVRAIPSDVESDAILDDGSLAVDDRPEYDRREAVEALQRVVVLAIRAQADIQEADDMISPLDQWDAFSVLSINELWELEERASFVDEMINRKVEDLSKEVGV